MHRVGEPQISPDGKWVAYAVATPDMDANRNASNIWMVSTEGGAPIQLTQSGHDTSPVWSPDAKTMAFISSRGGESQVYMLLDGGRRSACVDASFDRRGHGEVVAGWKDDRVHVIGVSGLQRRACNKKRDEEKEKNKVKAHVAEQLLYRHWTHWSKASAATCSW